MNSAIEKTNGTQPRAIAVPGGGMSSGGRFRMMAKTRSSVKPFAIANMLISRLKLFRKMMSALEPPELPVSGARTLTLDQMGFGAGSRLVALAVFRIASNL